jgi:hypothetical protein
MGDLNQQQLGELIVNENPYGRMTEIDLNGVKKSSLGEKKNAEYPYKDFFTSDQPEYRQGLFWTVGTVVSANPKLSPLGSQPETVRVSKAMRIRYKIGTEVHYLLVGYEGSGGM